MTNALQGTAETSARRAAAADVLIVEEYIPEYRRPFFEMLEAALSSESIRLRVAVGMAETELKAKTDAVMGMPLMQRVPAPSVSVAGRRVTCKRLSMLLADTDLVVVDQALRHLETYPLLLRQRRGPKVALWGHGTVHVKRSSRARRLAELGVARSAHWFFAYTEGGAERLAASGFPRDRVTVVQNTTGVSDLSTLRDGVTVVEQRLLREELRLPPRNVCLYVGALRASKRIGFLLEASAIVAQGIPDFVLVIAGDGEQRSIVERALPTSPWLRYVGRADGRRKAMLGAISDLLLMPGAVGLVAVDSFALQTPIVTTHSPYHGPEIEYLEDGGNARFSDDSVADFARTVERTLLDRDELTRLRRACTAARQHYSLEAMVENFARGVKDALRTPRRSRGMK